MEADGGGVGQIVQSIFLLLMIGTAAIGLLYVWKKGFLSFGEDPKTEMMKEDEHG